MDILEANLMDIANFDITRIGMSALLVLVLALIALDLLEDIRLHKKR